MGDLPGDEVVLSPPSPIVGPLLTPALAPTPASVSAIAPSPTDAPAAANAPSMPPPPPPRTNSRSRYLGTRAQRRRVRALTRTRRDTCPAGHGFRGSPTYGYVVVDEPWGIRTQLAAQERTNDEHGLLPHLLNLPTAHAHDLPTSSANVEEADTSELSETWQNSSVCEFGGPIPPSHHSNQLTTYSTLSGV